MLINVAQLLKEGTGATRSFGLSETIGLDNGTQCKIEGKVELLRTRRGILVRGDVTGTASLACSRCLCFFEQPLSFALEEEYLPLANVNTGVHLDVDEDAGGFVTDEHHTLDLSEAARQYLLLALPMKPVCGPDCAGLCPECGANLNQVSCSCAASHGSQPESELVRLNQSDRKLR